MCLTIQNGEFERTAVADMIVYKVLMLDGVAPFTGFQYKPNTIYRLDKKLFVNKFNEIEEGFHSYVSHKKALDMSDWFDYAHGTFTKVVEFAIPKGAKYYLGTDGDIVSTSIKSGNLQSKDKICVSI